MSSPRCAADMCRLDHRASGWKGAQDCQPATTLAACDQGQDKKNTTSRDSRWVRNVNAVAMPKLPPPPPWQAQNRSLLVDALQLRIVPSAVTICTDSRASLVSPKARPSTPTPPPRVRPATPTVGQEPPGTARPRAASRLYRSMRCRPVPTRTVCPVPTRNEFIAVTSTMSPVVPGVLDQPA